MLRAWTVSRQAAQPSAGQTGRRKYVHEKFDSDVAAAVAAVAFWAGGVEQAKAAMVLTGAGTSEGFVLSTFVSGVTNDGAIGPLAIGVTPAGRILVGDWTTGGLRSFTDTDGQTYSAGTPVGSYGAANAHSLARNGSTMYMVEKFAGKVVNLDPVTGAPTNVATGLGNPLDIVVNPTNGHLFVSGTNLGIVDIDPGTGQVVQFKNVGADGLTISADGSTLYGAIGGAVIGYNTTTGNQIFNTGSFDSVDGTALGTGSLAGKIYANTNSGNVWEIDLSNPSNRTLIATGGSRGDFVKVDSTNGTLLLTQTDRVLRLTPPSGGSFGDSAVPEPGTFALAGTGILGLLGYLRSRRKQDR